MAHKKKNISRSLAAAGLTGLTAITVVAPMSHAAEVDTIVGVAANPYIPTSSADNRVAATPETPIQYGLTFSKGDTIEEGTYTVQYDGKPTEVNLGGVLLINGQSTVVTFNDAGIATFEIPADTTITDELSGLHLRAVPLSEFSNREHDATVTYSRGSEALQTSSIYATLNPVLDEPVTPVDPAPVEPVPEPVTPENPDAVVETNVSSGNVATFSYQNVPDGDYTLVTKILSDTGEELKAIESNLTVAGDGEEDVTLGSLPAGTYRIVQAFMSATAPG